MIIAHNTIDLFGKMLFEKAIIQTPFKKPNPMPDEACFLYIQQGAYNSISEEEELVIYEEESVLMKCGHYLSQMLPPQPKGHYKAVAIHFYPDVLKRAYGNELPSFLTKYTQRFQANMVKLKASVLVKKYIESVLFYFENPQLVSEDIFILKLKEIILLLLQTENSPQVLQILTNLFSPKTFTFKEVVEAHIFSDISIAELAELTHHSLSSFKREFKKIYADTPGNYIKNQRLERAAHLLQISEETISNIAFDHGFKDIAHFSKSFKEKYGITPSAYRVKYVL